MGLLGSCLGACFGGPGSGISGGRQEVAAALLEALDIHNLIICCDICCLRVSGKPQHMLSSLLLLQYC